MLHHGQVYFNHWDRIYRPGEIVSGYLKIRLHTDKVVYRFYAELTGQARTSFPYGVLSCSGTEVYLQHRIDFIPNHNDETTTTTLLKAGIHKFYFDYVLPNNIPDTVMRPWGKISYIIKFSVDRPRPRVYKMYREFYVRRDLSALLPESPMVHMPIFGNFWFHEGQILGFMELPSSAYRPGSVIPIKVTVRNHSHLEIVKLICRLTKKVQFASTTPLSTVRTDKQVMAVEHMNHRIEPGRHRTMRVHLRIPNFVQNINDCSLMKDHFLVELNIRMLGFHLDIYRAVPIELVL